MTHRRTLLAAAGLAPLALASGCGLSAQEAPEPQGPVSQDGPLSGEISFQTWSLKNEKFSPYFEKLVSDFQDANPGTTVRWMDQPGEGYEDKVLQQAQAGQLPDVVNLPPGFAYQLSKVNKVLDLKSADPSVMEVYTPGGLKAYTFDGVDGVYGYPWYLGTDLNWWNAKAFQQYGLDPDKLPTTLDELFAAARTMAKKSDRAMPLISSVPGLTQLKMSGATLFTNGKFTFNTPDAAAILQEYVDLYQAGAMPAEALQNDYAGNATLYQQNKVAWTTGTPSFVGDLQKNAPSLVKVTRATPRIGTPPLFVQGISVAAESKNPALALAFAQYATNNDNQVAFVKIAQGFMPGTAEANADPESFTSSIDDKLTAEAVKLAASAMPQAEVINPIQFTDAMSTYTGQQIALAMRGDIAPQEALDKAVKYCNDNLDD